MRKIVSAATAFVLTVLAPSSALAWGQAAHRYIMSRAIDILPAELKPFFEHYRADLVVRVMDPDTWREIGWDDNPNHFVDFGVADYGPYPFSALPRDYSAAIAKFGVTTVRRYGLLPWREAEEFDNLRRTLAMLTKGSTNAASLVYAPFDVVLFTGAMSHYIQDATQPLHASDNFNGQLTNQLGIHQRFEDQLFERYRDRLTITPGPVSAVSNPRDVAFDELLASYLLVKPLLDADKDASAGKATYDDDYFEKLFTKTKPMLEKRLADAIRLTASMIVGAWEQAGRPTLRTEVPWPVEKVRR
jgi:hypothetical protein